MDWRLTTPVGEFPLTSEDKHKTEYLLLLLLFLTAFLPRLWLLTYLEVSGDEIVYISSGVVYIDNIVHGITRWEDWEINWEHPPLVKYLIGSMVYVFTDNEIKRIPHNELWIYQYMKPSDIYEDNILFLARFPYALIGSLTSVVVFFFGKELLNRRLGTIASLWLSFSYLWFYNTIWVQNLEAPETFFVTLALLLFYRGIMKTSYRYVTASGVVFGLALSCKYPAVLGILTALTWLLVLSMRGKFSFGFKSRNQVLLTLSLVAFIPIIVLTFILLWGWWIIPNGFERTVIHSINRHTLMGHVQNGSNILRLRTFDTFYLGAITKYFSFAFLHWPFLQWPLARLQSPEPFFILLGLIVLAVKIVQKRANSLEYLLLLYSVLPTICLSVLRSKMTHYILLVWPSLILISTLGLYEVLRRIVVLPAILRNSTMLLPRSINQILMFYTQDHESCAESRLDVCFAISRKLKRVVHHLKPSSKCAELGREFYEA